VYVSDSGAHRVLVFDQAGEEVARFGTRGLIRGSFDSPRGLVFNEAGELIVLDHANHRGIIVSPDGEYVDAFGPRSYVRPAQRPESFKEEDYAE
jgi:DNA-binding beta-propeller fold protein YncE